MNSVENGIYIAVKNSHKKLGSEEADLSFRLIGLTYILHFQRLALCSI